MSSLILRARRLLAELTYAQRRTLELRTGVSFSDQRRPPRGADPRYAGLEALWSAPAAAR